MSPGPDIAAQCGDDPVRGIETNFPTLLSWAGGRLAFAQVSMVTLVIVANIHLEKVHSENAHNEGAYNQNTDLFRIQRNYLFRIKRNKTEISRMMR